MPIDTSYKNGVSSLLSNVVVPPVMYNIDTVGLH